MRREKLFTALWSVVLGFLLSFSAVAGMASAFDMQVSIQALAWTCLAAALLASVCYSLPLGLVMPAVFALTLGYFFRTGALEQTAESLLFRLSRQYRQGYGWPIIRWSGRTAEQLEQTLPLVLCLLGILIAFFICRGICRKKSVIFGVVPNVLCLATCFVVNDTPPDTVFLFLQSLCLIVLLLTAGVRRRDAAQGNRLTLFALPVTALALLVLFACIPQNKYSSENAKKFSRWFTQSSVVQTLLGHTDSQAAKDNVDLTQVGDQMASAATVMEVKADYSGTLYLRGRALDHYDGVSWQQSEGDTASGLNWPVGLKTAGVVEISTNYAHSMLYVPYYAASSNMRESSYGVENGNKLTEYSFSTLVMPVGEELMQYHADHNGLQYFMSQYISLPEDVQKWAKPMVLSLAGERYDVLQIAQNVADFVKRSASYDTTTPTMPQNEKDFAKWFLEQGDTGYCVHFATGATVLLQAAGIPARYVTGYMLQAEAGEMVDVTGKDAHAWCEYWLPGYGWTVLEATPGDLRPEQMEDVTVPAQTPEQTIPENTPNVAQKPQKDMRAVQILIGLAGIAVAAWLQYAVRVLFLKRRLQKGSTNAQAIARWQYGVRLAKCLKETLPEKLQTLAEKARFSQHKITREELAVFKTYEAYAVGVLNKKNIFVRLYCRLVLALY